jgi:outer membrane protein
VRVGIVRYFSAMPMLGGLGHRAIAGAFKSLAAFLLVAPQPTGALAQSVTAHAAQARRNDTLPAVRLDTLLDLETVIRRALAVSPAVTGAQQGVRIAHSERRLAFGEYVPSVAATSAMLGSNVTTLGSGGTTPPAAYSAGLAASVDVFTGGRRGADRDRALEDLNAAQAGSVSQSYAVIYSAKAAFYETLRAADLVDVAHASVAQSQQGVRYADDRVRAGTTTRSDQLRAQLALTQSRQQLVAALDTLQAAAFALGRIVGSDGPVGGRRPESLEPRALALSDSEVVRLAVDASPAVQAAQAQERAGIASARATRTQYVPDLRITAGYNWASQSTLIYAIHPGWLVQVGTSYPLFNGFQREDEITRADALTHVARATALDATRQARSDAARLLSGLHFAEQNIALAADAVRSAAEDLRVQDERYRAGIATELDLLTSELAHTQTQIALVAARYNYQLTRAQLETLVGRSL